MRPRARATAGFTLIELTVVFLVIGLIATVATISWRAMLPNQELNTALRNLSEVLYGTRSDAISRSRTFRIYYDIDQDRYRVRSPFRPDGGMALTDEEEHVWLHETDLARSGIDLLQVTVDDVPYTDGLVYVRFDPLGAASHHMIVLRQTRFERDFTVEVLPLTGEVRVHDGLYERKPAEENDFR
jgi:Tfp pilus assembly protein FimT